jgi:hypothetical protein
VCPFQLTANANQGLQLLESYRETTARCEAFPTCSCVNLVPRVVAALVFQQPVVLLIDATGTRTVAFAGPGDLGSGEMSAKTVSKQIRV